MKEKPSIEKYNKRKPRTDETTRYRNCGRGRRKQNERRETERGAGRCVYAEKERNKEQKENDKEKIKDKKREKKTNDKAREEKHHERKQREEKQ